MGAGLVIAPHTGADAQSLGGLGLGHPVSDTPCAQPRAALLEGETPKRIGGDFLIVRPMDAPAPLANGHRAEQIVVGPNWGKDIIVREMSRHIDDAFGPPFPNNHETAVFIRAD